ncbi:hypothetical protein [Calditerricola satsumensis]|uniref:hypothetical protein n=1 Tax=Calditerricola satsumensis TaxID=373054 RepID=UPI00155DD67B|nr:hypothetical protein [Calditerricola satsumensis]
MATQPGSDVVGYRVYRVDPSGRERKLGAVPAHEPLQFVDPAPEAMAYRVIAVDVAGRVSGRAEVRLPHAPSRETSLPASAPSHRVGGGKVQR